MFKVVKRIVNTNQNKICDGVLAASDEHKKIALKSYQEKVLNAEFTLDGNGFSTHTISIVHSLIDKDMVRESIR